MVTIDGTEISGVTIDGEDVSEITVDGDTVWTATPDSVVDSFETYPDGWTDRLNGGFLTQSTSNVYDGSNSLRGDISNNDAITTIDEATEDAEYGRIEGYISVDDWTESNPKGPYGFFFRVQSSTDWIFGGVANGHRFVIVDGQNNVVYDNEFNSTVGYVDESYNKYDVRLNDNGSNVNMELYVNGTKEDSTDFTPDVTGTGWMGVGKAVSSAGETTNGHNHDLTTFYPEA